MTTEKTTENMTTGHKRILSAGLACALAFLVIGFAAGLVVSGRLDLTDPASAQSSQKTAAAPAPRPTATLPISAPLPDLSAVAEAALKVSANITSTTTVQAPDDPWLRLWYGDQPQSSKSLGSGVIVSPDGYVLTNTHVIGNAGADIEVTLREGKPQPGKIIGIDPVSDLAVVKVTATTPLPTLPWGDSDKLRVAQWVLAVGNPFQLSGTVTLGIVSTVKRPGAEVGGYANFIQTDAAINPGNSGGALVNARGELVGINSMIYSETGGYQGIGFAIPSNLAQQIMKELIDHGKISWGSIGNVAWITIDRETADNNGLTVTGAYVRAISTTSSAYRAGLRPHDIVVAINGQKVTSGSDIDRLLIPMKVGTTVKLSVADPNGRSTSIDVPVVARADTAVTR